MAAALRTIVTVIIVAFWCAAAACGVYVAWTLANRCNFALAKGAFEIHTFCTHGGAAWGNRALWAGIAMALAAAVMRSRVRQSSERNGR